MSTDFHNYFLQTYATKYLQQEDYN